MGGLGLSWLLLVALGMLWAAFLNPTKKASPAESVRAFETDMGRLKSDLLSAPPHPSSRPRSNAAARLRARRRRVFTALLQAFSITFLVGIMPALRWMWAAAGVLLILLAVYVWMLLGHAAPHGRRGGGPSRGSTPPPARRRTPFPEVALDGTDDDIVIHRTRRRSAGA